jgi:hypothetical protein
MWRAQGGARNSHKKSDSKTSSLAAAENSSSYKRFTAQVGQFIPQLRLEG